MPDSVEGMRLTVQQKLLSNMLRDFRERGNIGPFTVHFSHDETSIYYPLMGGRVNLNAAKEDFEALIAAGHIICESINNGTALRGNLTPELMAAGF